MSSLNDKLAKLAGEIIKKLPEDFALANEQAVEKLVNSQSIMGLEVGEKAPIFTLPDASGELVSLTSLLEQGPVVLSFYRGSW